jgi:hypothetical protein
MSDVNARQTAALGAALATCARIEAKLDGMATKTDYVATMFGGVVFAILGILGVFALAWNKVI